VSVSTEYVNFLLVAVAPGDCPIAKIPTVLLPVAYPAKDATDDAVVEALVSPEYVYLSLVVVSLPNAKIPTVLLPVAAPN
jgi:hypothetical protein